MAETPKTYSLFNTGKRRYPLGEGPDKKPRVLEPGKSRTDLSEAEFARLKRYPELVDPSKMTAGGGDIVAKLHGDNKALAKRVKELEVEVEELRAKAPKDQKDKGGQQGAGGK